MKGLNSHIISLSHSTQTVRYGRARVVTAAGGYSRNGSSIHNDDKQFLVFDRQMHVAYAPYDFLCSIIFYLRQVNFEKMRLR